MSNANQSIKECHGEQGSIGRRAYGSFPQLDLRELDDILLETRTRGYAVETGEITPEYASVAVAALDHNGYPAAAIGITFRKIAVDQTLWKQLGAAAQISAGALSMRMRGKI